MASGLQKSVALASSASWRFRDDVRSDDCHAVRVLVESTGYFRSDEIEIAAELVEERLERGAASGYEFAFAEIGATIIGYACFGHIPCTAASFDLYWIAVDPLHQNNGIGRALVSAVQERVVAMGGERLYIDTSGKDQYASTRAFYERNGFYCDARLRDFYAPGDDRVIYAKILSARAEGVNA
jgi:ribosomal protein S18 acetylase RimI-like enzyme